MSYSVNGSKVELAPEQIRIEEGKSSVKGSSSKRCVTFLIVVLLIAALVLAALFAVYYIQAKNGDDDDDEKECTTRNCVNAASRMMAKMDIRADPCQDYAQYACGVFYRDTVIPDDLTRLDELTVLRQRNKEVLRRIMEDPIQKNDPSYLKKMKILYRDCRDEDKIEEIGITHYTTNPMAKKWPTTNPAWNSTNFDLTEITAEYEGEFVQSLFYFYIDDDPGNRTRPIIHFADPYTSIKIQLMFLPRNNSFIMADQQYYEDMAVALGADQKTAQNDAKAEKDFEVKLAELIRDAYNEVPQTHRYNPTTLRNMSVDYPYLDWHRVIQAAFDTVGKKIPEDMPINIRIPPYFKRLGELLNTTSPRVIANRFGYKFARTYVENLSKKFREIYNKYVKVLDGIQNEPPRYKKCIDITTQMFPYGMAKQFIKATFSEDSKNYIVKMIDHMVKQLKGMIQNADWLGQETKKTAFLKLDKMKRWIGYPEKGFDDKDLDELYKGAEVFPGEFVRTGKRAIMQGNRFNLLGYYMPKEKPLWPMNPLTVNAQSQFQTNQIVFPGGILQPSFYDADSPSSVRYGSIGTVIGHEVSHLFDNSGSRFDETGDLRDWWKPEDLAKFNNRIQCLIDQYSSYVIKQIGMNVDGKLTVGENTADIGGIRAAFRAYNTFAATQPKELPLPGLGLTPKKQFFLAFAQLWCGKVRDEALKGDTLNDPHSPSRFRINGALQDIEEFAKTYQCPLGSPMNPAKKCVVW